MPLHRPRRSARGCAGRRRSRRAHKPPDRSPRGAARIEPPPAPAGRPAARRLAAAPRALSTAPPANKATLRRARRHGCRAAVRAGTGSSERSENSVASTICAGQVGGAVDGDRVQGERGGDHRGAQQRRPLRAAAAALPSAARTAGGTAQVRKRCAAPGSRLRCAGDAAPRALRWRRARSRPAAAGPGRADGWRSRRTARPEKKIRSSNTKRISEERQVQRRREPRDGAGGDASAIAEALNVIRSAAPRSG